MNKRILIIGAGLAGLALYKTLDKTRFTVHLADKRQNLGSLGFGILFYPVGGFALRRLGVDAESVKNLGWPYSQYYFRNTDATLREIVDYGPLVTEFGYYQAVARDDLYQPLFKDINADDLLLGHAVTEIKEADTEVHVTFDDGTVRTYDFVIGADGAHSIVRKTLFPDSKAEPLGNTFLWSWVPKKDVEALPPRPTLYFGDDANLGVLDMKDPERAVAFCWFTKETLDKNADHAAWNDYLKQHFSSFAGTVPSIMEAIYNQQDRFVHSDYQVKLETWHKGRVGLIGDAAHALSILTGLGSSLALEDGVFLGETFNKTDDLANAFQNFESTQRSRTIDVTLDRFAQTEGALAIMKEIFSSSPVR